MKRTKIKRAIEKKYPEWVTMLVTVGEDGVPNAMPAGWVTFTSIEPVIMAVSVGHSRYSHRLMEKSDQFVITYPSEKQKEDVYYCGNNSGEEVDKFSETSLEPTEPAWGDVPLIKGSVVCFECEKRGSMKTGDHTLFAGEVRAAHVGDDELNKIYTVRGWTDMGYKGFRTISEIQREAGGDE